MVNHHDSVVWLKDIDKDDELYVGGKAANLGEMISAKFPVPNGFVITSNAFSEFIRENKLELKIKHLLGTIDYKNPDSMSQVSSHIRKIIISSRIPDSVSSKVFKYYAALGKNPLVAVRSSATAEDSKDASFAGQQETFLNVRGDAALLESIREAWASLYKTRALFYRRENKFDSSKSSIALVVQKMIESESSGIMFTIDPVSNEKTRIVIEAVYGLGEYIVQGKITPDHYDVNKEDFKILHKRIAEQKIMLKKYGSGNKETKVSFFAKFRQKISDKDIKELAKIGRDIEKHYYFPQDIEWAKEKGKIYVVQTRPITTTVKKEDKKAEGITPFHSQKPILLGDPASPGIGIGKVKILRTPNEISKMNDGDVLVAPYTNPDYVPAMKKAKAIITEKGGRTSHAAIVSREFGIPAVVGAENAIKILKDGMIVTVHGKTGEIFKGSLLINDKSVSHHENIHTKTKIYVNLAEPELAEKVAAMNVDGVGLLRAEFMIAGIGIHPKKLIKEGRQKLFVEKLSAGLETICAEFYPRPVIYRATDFKTNEYRNLVGGKDFEPIESNPMLGYRGAYRYINDPKVFQLELDAIKYIREKKGLNNLHLMIPFVRTVKEMSQVKKIISDQGLKRSPSFKLYMMVEIPSNVILLEDFIEQGIDGVSIGSNDLTMLLLGIDRDNEEVSVEFDERNKAVLWALEKIIKTCNKYKISSSICGQAPSTYPDLVEKLVDWGVSSISISPDALDITRNTVYNIEKQK